MRLRTVQIYDTNIQGKYDLTVSFRDCNIHGRINRSLSVEIIARDAVEYGMNISLTATLRYGGE